MNRSLPILMASGAWILWAMGPLGCEREARVEAGASEVAAPVPASFPGTYRVRGRTVDQRSGDTRTIEGFLSLQEEGGVYTGNAELETQFPSEAGSVDTHVLGTATGRLEGDELQGTAETQLVMASVPGVHAEFAFAPRIVGPRLESSWTARFRGDGTLIIELENKPAAGEEYSPTHTTLYGTRIEGADGLEEWNAEEGEAPAAGADDES